MGGVVACSWKCVMKGYSRGIILGALASLLPSFQALPVYWPLLASPELWTSPWNGRALPLLGAHRQSPHLTR